MHVIRVKFVALIKLCICSYTHASQEQIAYLTSALEAEQEKLAAACETGARVYFSLSTFQSLHCVVNIFVQ